VNVVDSSAWLEYLADGPNADFFAPAIQETERLIVPTISLYEVFKAVLRQRGEALALEAVALMKQGRIVPLDAETALSAATISTKLKIPMADSVILATARANRALLWTQDSDFKGLDNVRYIEKATSELKKTAV